MCFCKVFYSVCRSIVMLEMSKLKLFLTRATQTNTSAKIPASQTNASSEIPASQTNDSAKIPASQTNDSTVIRESQTNDSTIIQGASVIMFKFPQ